MISVNFEDTFEPTLIAEDFSYMKFNSVCKNGDIISMKIEISPLEYFYLPNVYNLAFGPIGNDGEIDDSIKINHKDTNKVFSTILFFSFVYLQANPEKTIGIDGSNDVRAYLYHRMFQKNRTNLSNYFVSIGVDWYVRLLRNGDVETDDHDEPFFKPKPEPFDYNRSAQDLYRYYMYHLK